MLVILVIAVVRLLQGIVISMMLVLWVVLRPLAFCILSLVVVVLVCRGLWSLSMILIFVVVY